MKNPKARTVYQQRHGERRTISLLRQSGRKVHVQSYHSNYDVTVDGLHIEIKSSTPNVRLGTTQKEPVWVFNIHRHNKLKEDGIDYYVLRFEGIPYSRFAVHAVIQAPVGLKTLCFGMRHLIVGEIAWAVGLWKRLLKGKLQGMKAIQATIGGYSDRFKIWSPDLHSDIHRPGRRR